MKLHQSVLNIAMSLTMLASGAAFTQEVTTSSETVTQAVSIPTNTTPFVSSGFAAAGRSYMGLSYSMSLPTSNELNSAGNPKFLKNGHGVNVNAGFFIANGFALEGSYTYNRHKTKFSTLTGESSGSLSSFGLTGKYFIDNASAFAPYIAVGANYNKLTDFKSNIVPTIGAGFAYQISPDMSFGLDMDYQFYEPKFDSSGSAVKYKMNPIHLNFGVKYHF